MSTNPRLEAALRKARELAKTPLFSVYFIQCQEFVKVGYARNVVTRLDAYRVHNTHEVKLLAAFNTRRPQADENLVHTALEMYRVRGEWFKLPERLMIWIKDNRNVLNVEALIQQALA